MVLLDVLGACILDHRDLACGPATSRARRFSAEAGRAPCSYATASVSTSTRSRRPASVARRSPYVTELSSFGRRSSIAPDRRYAAVSRPGLDTRLNRKRLVPAARASRTAGTVGRRVSVTRSGVSAEREGLDPVGPFFGRPPCDVPARRL